MTDDDHLPTVPSSLEGTVWGAWSGLLKAVPGAVSAIAEVVGELGHAGTAYASIATAHGRKLAGRIGNDTRIEKAAADELGVAASRYVEENATALGPRALEYGAKRFVKQQLNREAVVLKMLNHLENEPPKLAPPRTPTEDWFNVFGKLAENATSEKMQEHWSLILKGEIVRPGSFSFACLLLASIIDQNSAKTIEDVVPWIVDGSFVPVHGFTIVGEFYRKLLILDGIGFLRLTGSHNNTRVSAEGVLRIELASKLLLADGPPNGSVQLPSAILTPAGMELLSILPQDTGDAVLELLIDFLTPRGLSNFRIEDHEKADLGQQSSIT